ncbi:Alpha/beta hydrolase fold protein [Chondromyces apiculatus DSM 436]|uniref:Alpha/beta hydrolase fold protein n=1 Tax=Chondromyces apiculatus DSM 436 TaxID=1192034 RepID=A0A017TEY1_9BACT|nr:Alpha/beta hydrolase fold protein [Chondromyces apiculatus DSM 436]
MDRGARDGAAGRAVEYVVRDVTASGVRMRVLEAGATTRPTVVLIHDFLTSRLAFEDIIGPLSARFHVLAPDLPGFGESEKPSAARYAYGIEAFAEAIADLIAAFGVGRVHVVGHSMGGAVAITLAAGHRELVQRLVVEDPLCYPFPMGMRRKLPLVPVIGGIFFKQLWSRSMFRAYFRDTIFGPEAKFPTGRVERHYDLFNGPSARESAHAVLRAGLDARPVVARLTRIACPTLVVWGRDDQLFPVVSAQRLAREIPGARLEIMDAGHSPHEERPREFVALVTQFLEGRR